MMTPINIRQKYYDMATVGEDTVEINMYGDVVDQIPTDWWTGEPLEGEFICLENFLADLDKMSKAKNISLRINSYGGDCVAAFVIHNRLREMAREGKKTKCVIDGVAMSAASIIMSACDTVQVNPASLVMIHKCWTYIWGGYNADELKEMSEQNAAYDKAIASAYARKTGLSETQILHMMADTTYMTGKEAVEKGFADELIEDAEPLDLAASADGRSIFARGKQIHLAPGMFAPDSIPTVTPEAAAPVDKIKNEPEETGETEGGNDPMTVDELRTQFPDLVADVEASASAGHTDEIKAAVEAERERIKKIDEVASLFSDDLVNDAKYGEGACTAEQLAYKAALNAQKQGKNYLAQVAEDTEEANTESVESASAPEEKPEEAMTEDEKKALAESMMASLLGKKGE